jgi:cellobiose-specific phosphotransferase system component IIA
MATTNGGQQGVAAAGLQIQGGAAIMAPVSAFPNGVPGNALIVIPLSKVDDELKPLLDQGPTVVTPEQMWKLLGFNGPAVQVQDDQGRPIAIGLEDLLAGLDKHWQEQPDDLNRARIYAQELLKYNRLQRAEQVLSKIVAKGGTGEDWLYLGISQLSQEKLDKAEGTLKGAQNLLKDNPTPSLHLAKVYQLKKDEEKEREFVEKAIEINVGFVDAWAYLFQYLKGRDGEDKAIAEIEKLAAEKKSAAPYIALQGFYANDDETRDRAIAYAKKGVETAPDDTIALLCLSALYGQKGDLEAVIRLLQPHEAKMSRDVRLANNYFEALFQSRQIEKVTKLLNALAGSASKEVKQFAIERSRLVAQFLQQQQQQLAAATQQRKA